MGRNIIYKTLELGPGRRTIYPYPDAVSGTRKENDMNTETEKWAVQIPADDGGSETIGYAATAEEAAELARERGVTDPAELYPRLDYCEWHVGF